MKSAVHSRALFVCLVLVAGFSVLSGRLIHLQWFDRELSVGTAASARTNKETLPGWHGNIVDRNEEIMARNLPVTTIIADKVHLRTPIVAARGIAYAMLVDDEEWIHATDEERRSLLRRRQRQLCEETPAGVLQDMYIEHVIPITARALGMPSRDLKSKLIDSDLKYVTIAKDLREDEAEEIEETLRENHIHGFRFEKSVKRWYTTGQLATHTTGYVNHEGVGQCGVERALEKYLRGKDGYRIVRKDQTGLVVLTGGGKLMPPRSGFDVKLTLDLSIQAIVEEELDRGLQEFESSRGAVVMIEPRSGDVMAIASRPHFDLNVREDLDNTGVHYAVQAIYEPGSTFKLVATSAALDLGIMTPATKVNCYNGWRQMKGYTVPDHHPYGMLSLEEVLAKSSNTGAFEIALRVGKRRFVDYVKKYGFTEKTGILLSDEQGGIFHYPEKDVDFSRMAFGYCIAVTPLQVACAYASIANDGMRMKPRLVQALLANDGTVVKEFPPEEAQRVVSARTAQKMRTALEGVMGPNATGRRGNVPGYRTGGKTGTAKKLSKSGGYLANHYTVSFVGMLPIERPRFVCVVVIDDPLTKKVKIGGGTVAAPVFKAIAGRTAAYLNLTPTEPIEGDEALAQKEQ